MASAAKPVLIYFKAPGRAEASRLLLADKGVDYVNEYAGADWPTQKAAMVAEGKLLFHRLPAYYSETGEEVVESKGECNGAAESTDDVAACFPL
jgi:hypothetical protein